MSSCDQGACALELPAPRACRLHLGHAACSAEHPATPHPYSTALAPLTMPPADPPRSRVVLLCFPLNVPGSQAQTGSLQNQGAPGTVAWQAQWPGCARSLTLVVLALLVCRFTVLCSQNGGQGESPWESPRMLRDWSLTGGCEMCLGGTALPCIPSLHHQTHLVPTLVPSPAQPGQGSCVLGRSCCSTGGLGLASRGAKGPAWCGESSVVSQSSPQATLRSQAPAKEPLGGGKPTPPTKCRSMMDVQSPTTLGSTALGTWGFGQLGREGRDGVARGHQGVQLVLGQRVKGKGLGDLENGP